MAEGSDIGKTEQAVVALIALFVIVPFFPCLICAMDGAATLLRQCGEWFKTGRWQPRDFWSGIHYWFLADRPSFEWVIPNRVLNWMLDGPRAEWMLVWSLLLGIAATGLIAMSTACFSAAADRWAARHERPIIVLTKREMLACFVSFVCVGALPIMIFEASIDESFVGEVIIFFGIAAAWTWARLGKARSPRRKPSSDDMPPIVPGM